VSENPLARHGGLSYLHIPTRDAEKSAVFYERVLGWAIDRRDNGTVRFATPDGFLIGGFGSDEPGTGMKAWFYVDGIDAAIERVTASGGKIVEPLRVEGDTRVVEIQDPAGNRLGLWQFA
jgi:predicted enzyme related to lactoylglutathione lyase